MAIQTAILNQEKAKDERLQACVDAQKEAHENKLAQIKHAVEKKNETIKSHIISSLAQNVSDSVITAGVSTKVKDAVIRSEEYARIQDEFLYYVNTNKPTQLNAFIDKYNASISLETQLIALEMIKGKIISGDQKHKKEYNNIAQIVITSPHQISFKRLEDPMWEIKYYLNRITQTNVLKFLKEIEESSELDDKLQNKGADLIVDCFRYGHITFAEKIASVIKLDPQNNEVDFDRIKSMFDSLQWTEHVEKIDVKHDGKHRYFRYYQSSPNLKGIQFIVKHYSKNLSIEQQKQLLQKLDKKFGKDAWGRFCNNPEVRKWYQDDSNYHVEYLKKYVNAYVLKYTRLSTIDTTDIKALEEVMKHFHKDALKDADLEYSSQLRTAVAA